ncbi:MAG: DUF4215 domain-containing protein [Candidatus Peribacteraceae bacterium]|nr:DUF4215 domain-containing protein [Candidatus Peribacteraceae bacterium]
MHKINVRLGITLLLLLSGTVIILRYGSNVSLRACDPGDSETWTECDVPWCGQDGECHDGCTEDDDCTYAGEWCTRVGSCVSNCNSDDECPLGTICSAPDCIADPCGDGSCDSGEGCAADCATELFCDDLADNDQDASMDCDDSDCAEDPACICGNGQIDEGENCHTCEADAGCTSPDVCLESSEGAGDWSCTACGNGQVDEGEDCANCSADAGCDEGESCVDIANEQTCVDTCTILTCGACESCSEGVCHTDCTGSEVCDENTNSCTLCGNSQMDEGENCETCPADVGCAGNETCDTGICVSNCSSTCAADETCAYSNDTWICVSNCAGGAGCASDETCTDSEGTWTCISNCAGGAGCDECSTCGYDAVEGWICDSSCQDNEICAQNNNTFSCTICGNGQIDEGENCHTCEADAGCTSPDVCLESSEGAGDWSCTACGNGQVDEGEDCANCSADAGCDEGETCTDDGAGDYSCVSDPFCGDGIVNAEESCDDGDTDTSDGCSATCTVETGWACAGSSPSVCYTTCGDGFMMGGEECDDGDAANGNGCSATCTVEAGWSCTDTSPSACSTGCGDSITAGNEECDDGNQTDGDGCSAACDREECGDGAVNNGGTETCDDGNVTASDGCSSMCAIETGYACSGTPSRCFVSVPASSSSSSSAREQSAGGGRGGSGGTNAQTIGGAGESAVRGRQEQLPSGASGTSSASSVPGVTVPVSGPNPWLLPPVRETVSVRELREKVGTGIHAAASANTDVTRGEAVAAVLGRYGFDVPAADDRALAGVARSLGILRGYDGKVLALDRPVSPRELSTLMLRSRVAVRRVERRQGR